MTQPTQMVLRLLVADPLRKMYGLELCDEARLPSGTVYPILARLEGLGWLESEWEDPAAHVTERRPRRRYYVLTKDGAARARTALDLAERANGRPSARLRPAGA